MAVNWEQYQRVEETRPTDTRLTESRPPETTPPSLSAENAPAAGPNWEQFQRVESPGNLEDSSKKPRGSSEPDALEAVRIGAENILPEWRQQAGGAMVALGEREKIWQNRLHKSAGELAEGMKQGFWSETQARLKNVMRLAEFLFQGGAYEGSIRANLSPEQRSILHEAEQALADRGREIWQNAQKDIKPLPRKVLAKIGSFEVSDPAYYAGAALQSGVGTMAPGMAIAMLTRNPEAGLSVMGAQVYGQTYAAQRAKGKSPGEAHAYAYFDTIAETLTEKIPFDYFVGAKGKTYVRRVLGGVLSEGGQEILNEAMEIARDEWDVPGSVPAKQVIRRLLDSGIIGGLMGGVGGALSFRGPKEGETGTEGGGGEQAPPLQAEDIIGAPKPAAGGAEQRPPEQKPVDWEQFQQVEPTGQGPGEGPPPSSEGVLKMPPGLEDARLKRETHRARLQEMRNEIVKGGEMGVVVDETTGHVKARTPSVNPSWFQGIASDPATKVTVEQAKSAIDKALAGERLGVREARVVGAMLDSIGEERQGQVDYAREQLDAARKERRAALQGFPPISAYEDKQAGEIFQEQAYDPEWTGPTRALSEIAREARDVDKARADAILERQASDSEIARELAALIAEKASEQEAKPAEAAGPEGAGTGEARPGPAEEGRGAGVQAEAAPAAEESALSQLPDSALIAAAEYSALDPVDFPINRLSPDEQAIVRQAGLVRKAETETGEKFDAVPMDALFAERERRFKAQKEARQNAVQPSPVSPVRGEGKPGGEGPGGLEGTLPRRPSTESQERPARQEENQGRPQPRERKPLGPKLTEIPEAATVQRAAVVEETGQEVTMRQNAREALREVRASLAVYHKLLECVRG